MHNLKTTNSILLIIVVPIIFYLLKILSFIFVPLVSAMFIALLFLPLMRWLNRKKVPQIISIVIVILIFAGLFKIGAEILKYTSHEILSADNHFLDRAKIKLIEVAMMVEQFFGMNRLQDQDLFSLYMQNDSAMKNISLSLDFIKNFLSGILTTSFFVVLLLSRSINFEKLLNSTLFKVRHSSIKAFRRIEKDIIKFVIVKFVISLFTGIGFSIACLAFDVSFPVFWGVFAFAINFVQMIGSVISVALLSLFALIELEPSGILLFFVLSIIAVQVIMGAILEPVFMGKTFSVNVLTILIMLMLWGYIWGIPGLILAIPITVFIKIILDQNPKFKIISELISGERATG